MIVIRHDPSVDYPSPDDGFSPSEVYPEYRFTRIARQPNRVYEMVRSLLVDAGLDATHLGTPDWNPLGTFIPPGSTVFVLCNFVYHRRFQDDRAAIAAKCIHGSVLRAVLDYVLLAVGPEGKVAFGNAPLQSCRWNEVLRDTGAADVLSFYRDAGAGVSAKDLRLYVTERDLLGRVVRAEHRESGSDFAAEGVEVDLGAESLLAELGPARDPRFRVSDYDPRRIADFHRDGTHRYVIHHSILDADVVISLSKLKTHEKVGITCGLKGYVGAVAHKDCLAHHRFGSSSVGGDEYPNDWPILNAYSRFHDWVNLRGNGRPLQSSYEVLDRTIRRVLRRLHMPAAGAWSGNDTCWRMALDLARIVHFADRSGRMTETLQRRHLTFIDGVTAGEGNGPLAPRPVQAGVILFGDNVAEGDRLACRLMGLDPAAIPLVTRSFEESRYPVSSGRTGRVLLDGRRVDEESVGPVMGRPFSPPEGWKHHFEARS